MLQTVHESKDVDHQHIGYSVEYCGLWIKHHDRKKDASADHDDGCVTPTLVPTLRNNERSENGDEMHDQIMGRYIEPFQDSGDFQNHRMSLEKGLVFEPDRIVIIDMVSEMFVADVLVGSIGRTAYPVEKAPETRIGSVGTEHRVVPALVNHVCGDRHRVRQQQGRQNIDKQIVGQNPKPSKHVPKYGIHDRPTVIEQADRFVKCFRW